MRGWKSEAFWKCGRRITGQREIRKEAMIRIFFYYGSGYNRGTARAGVEVAAQRDHPMARDLALVNLTDIKR
jgi:hypothetical protein